MKPTMLFAIFALAAIVIASSFDVHLSQTVPLAVPAGFEGQALYVCPAASPSWDAVASALRPFHRYLSFIFFFAVIILMFSWGWALYQNLLKDKLDSGSFSKPWQFTKFTFWAGVIILIAAATPNHFKTVKIDGADGAWVLCENTTPGARAVLASKVHR